MTEKKLPKNISIFPLPNVVFFPGTILPLNIFEKRYIQLVNDCMKKQRLFGIVQPKKKFEKNSELYKVGCLGKVVNFNETSDNRFVISVSGLIRFRIKGEINTEKLYRKFSVDYSEYTQDLKPIKKEIINYDKNKILIKIKLLFKKLNYSVELDELMKLNFDQLVNTICMISPFSNEEKQKLIEVVKIEDKVKSLEEIINFNLASNQQNKTIQ